MIVEFKRLTRVLPTVYLNLLRHLDKLNLKKIRLKWSGITVHLGRRLPGGSTHERVAANNTSAKDGAQTRVKSNWTQGREGLRHATAPKRTGGYCAPSGRPMGTNLLPFYDTWNPSTLSHDHLEAWAASSDVLRGVHGAVHRLFPLPASGRFSLTR
jgi:hypothetical protein